MLWPLLVAAAISYALEASWPLIATLCVLLGWQIWQKWRLARWLTRGELLDPPFAGGLWEDYYTRLMHLFRAEQRTQNSLTSIINQARQWADSLDEGLLLLDTGYRLTYHNRVASELLGLLKADSGAVITNLLRHPQFSNYLEHGDFTEPLRLSSPVNSAILQYRITALQEEGLLLRVADVSRIARLESMRRDFVANVSHELKTPITVFKGSLELLLDQLPDDKPHLARLLHNMALQSDRMDALVHDLLLLSRLEGTPADPQDNVSLDALTHKLKNTFNTKAANLQQQLVWQITPGLKVSGNAGELTSAFTNLVDNALTHTPTKGRIIVSCRQDKNHICFTVQDNGPGIDPKHIPHLTERFYRVDASRNSGSGGTGLGLAIVKHVLQRHNGQLSIESIPGEGSRFRCHLPLPSLKTSHAQT